MSDAWEREKNNVGDGWKPIVERLHDSIEKHAGPHRVLQIKEKFGGLRYYFSMSPDVAEDKRSLAHRLVADAEAESERTCEECGRPGKSVSIGGWYRTLCETDRAVITHERELRDAEMKAQS